jgi:hypothetical protein
LKRKKILFRTKKQRKRADRLLKRR